MEITTNSEYPFLAGGGEMGLLFRSYNWGDTALGTPDQWPQSLRTTVNHLLNSRFPMFLFWGPQLVQFYNDAYRPSLGINGKHPAALGQSAQECWPEAWHLIKPQIDHIRSGGESTWSEDQMIPLHRNGKLEEAYWTFSYSPVQDEAGEVAGVLVSCQETTHTVLNRLRMEQTQSQILSFFEQSTVAVAILDKKDLTFRMANPFYGFIAGRPVEELVDKPLMEALPELAGQGFDNLLMQVIETGEPYIANEVAAELVRNGQLETIYVNLTYQPRRETDNSISGIFVIATDVTQQVLTRNKIQESEQILRDMILRAPIGICLLNASNLVCEIVNSSFIEVAGKPYDQIIGKNYWEPFAEAAPYFEKALDQVVKNGEPFYANEVPLMLIRHGREEKIYVTFVYMPLVDTNEIVTKVAVWVLENTTQVIEREKIENIVNERTRELRIANDQLKEMNDLLALSNDNLEKFAYVASHDLQEPLRKIQQFGDLLKNRYVNQGIQEMDYLERMLSSADRMSILIKDLLEYSKITHVRALIDPVQLNRIVEGALATLDRIIFETDAEITVDQLPTIPGDAVQLHQLFQNLLSNALKFMKSPSIPIIRIGCQIVSSEQLPVSSRFHGKGQSYYQIDVTDNGVGFDEKYRDRIFQMFQRLHGRSEFAGTGIGLAIAEKVVANHSGAISARSQPGHGATFSLFFPVSENSIF